MTLAHSIVYNPIILGSILRSLDPGDILTCRRVCTFFNDTINSSKEVRLALYLFPAAAPTAPIPYGQGVLYKINPLLKAKFKPFFSINMNSNYGLWGDTALNQLLPNDGRTAMKSEWDQCLSSLRALFRSDANWRDMLVTQPPIMELEVIRLTDTHSNIMLPHQPLRFTRLQFEEGLTMGALYDTVFSCVGIENGGSFAVDWKASSPQRHATNTHHMYGSVADVYANTESARPWSVWEDVIMQSPRLVLILRTRSVTHTSNQAQIDQTMWKSAFMPANFSDAQMRGARFDALSLPRHPHYGWTEEWHGLVHGANRTAGTPEDYLRDRQVFFGALETSYEKRFNHPSYERVQTTAPIRRHRRRPAR